jgi:hypothetical protein
VGNRRARKPGGVWGEGLAFALDCQAVIAERMMRLMGGDARAFSEASRMLAEKPAVAVHAQWAAAVAAPGRAFDDAFGTYRRAVSANRRRLERR